MTIERTSKSFLRLFEVRLMHHYWLDSGPKLIDAFTENEQQSRLLRYDARRIFGVTPSLSTASIIAGLRGLFRTTGLGFIVAVPDGVVVPLDAFFEFYLTVADSAYDRYTAATIARSVVVDVIEPGAEPGSQILHRYRSNVPVLSNATGVSRGAGDNKRLHLSQEYPAALTDDDRVEAMIRVGTSLRQLTSDPPDLALQDLGPRADLPIYVHRGDVPTITPPARTTGAPTGGVALSSDMPIDVAVVVRLVPQRAAPETAYSFVNSNGTPRTPARVFEVHFRNRSTVRRYRNRYKGSITSTEAEPSPLTASADATQLMPRPSLDSTLFELDTDTPPHVTRILSDIYV
jgi:hypothetical protein